MDIVLQGGEIQYSESSAPTETQVFLLFTPPKVFFKHVLCSGHLTMLTHLVAKTTSLILMDSRK